MINENFLGIIAGILTCISMLPQLIKVLKEKNVDDLSPVILLTLIIGLSLWVWYGIMKTEVPIQIALLFS